MPIIASKESLRPSWGLLAPLPLPLAPAAAGAVVPAAPEAGAVFLLGAEAVPAWLLPVAAPGAAWLMKGLRECMSARARCCMTGGFRRVSAVAAFAAEALPAGWPGWRLPEGAAAEAAAVAVEVAAGAGPDGLAALTADWMADPSIAPNLWIIGDRSTGVPLPT